MEDSFIQPDKYDETESETRQDTREVSTVPPADDILRKTLDVDAIINNVLSSLGEYVVTFTEKKEVVDGVEVVHKVPSYVFNNSLCLTSKGVTIIRSLLNATLNPNTILMNVDQNEVNLIMRDFMETLINITVVNWREFGKDDPKDLELFWKVVENAVFPAICRAKLNGERNFMKGSERYVYGESKKRGFFDFLRRPR